MIYTNTMSIARYVALIFLVACGTQNTTLPKDALRFNISTLGTAYTEENYDRNGFVSGGQTPYRLKVVEGALPKGMTVNNLQLSGMPTEVGDFTFTLEVSDAALSTKQQKLTLQVQAPPPPVLKISFPEGTIQNTRVPVVLENFKKVKAGHLEWELPKNISLTGVDTGAGKSLMIWKVKNNVLKLDFVLTEALLRDNKILFLNLNATEPTALKGEVYYQLYAVQSGSGTPSTPLLGKKDPPMKSKPTSSTPPATEPSKSTSGSSGSTTTPNQDGSKP